MITLQQIDEECKDVNDPIFQHTGGSISSRQAEEILIQKGILATRENISEHNNADHSPAISLLRYMDKG